VVYGSPAAQLGVIHGSVNSKSGSLFVSFEPVLSQFGKLKYSPSFNYDYLLILIILLTIFLVRKIIDYFGSPAAQLAGFLAQLRLCFGDSWLI
jgi:hypothetical protein